MLHSIIKECKKEYTVYTQNVFIYLFIRLLLEYVHAFYVPALADLIYLYLKQVEITGSAEFRIFTHDRIMKS